MLRLQIQKQTCQIHVISLVGTSGLQLQHIKCYQLRIKYLQWVTKNDLFQKVSDIKMKKVKFKVLYIIEHFIKKQKLGNSGHILLIFFFLRMHCFYPPISYIVQKHLQILLWVLAHTHLWTDFLEREGERELLPNLPKLLHVLFRNQLFTVYTAHSPSLNL